MKIKIIGAGSIGNHLAQASRRVGAEVVVVDADPKALRRMRDEIYPSRYGRWDETIKLFTPAEAPRGGFDVIMIGTPPHVRIPLATEVLKERPRLLHLEKPLCGPRLEGLKKFLTELSRTKTKVIVGYDHAVSRSVNFVVELLRRRVIGEVETIDVEFREHWGGIFKAHPWLSGPQDSYLGFRAKGGGASGEHSHALHLWQYLAKAAGIGRWKKVSHIFKHERGGGVDYDSIASFSFLTDEGKHGRVVQDVVTKPTRKWARIQGRGGFIEWLCGGHARGDLVRYAGENGKVRDVVFAKTRPDDFYQELLHIRDILGGKIKHADSPLALQSALQVMSVLKTADQDSPASAVLIRKI